MSVTRRKFLGILTAGAGAATVIPARSMAQVHDFEGYPDRFGLLTDITRCIGCRSCEKGCNEFHGLPEPDVPFEDLSVLDTKRRTTEAAYTVVNKYQPSGGGEPVFRKHQCNHCNEPACVSACFVKALIKTKEGPVIWDKDLCVGCRYCIVSCPFYAPAYEYNEPLTPRVMKCTMCFEKITKTGGGATACAEACPTEAITFGKRSDLIAVARDRIRREPDRYIDHIYGEQEIGGTSWMYLSGVPFNDVDLPEDIGRTPYPKFTKGALASVPPIIMLWPVLLGGIYYMTKRREAIEDNKLRTSVHDAIETTRAEEKALAKKNQETALKKQEKQFERKKKKEINDAVKEALEKAAGEGKEEEGKEDGSK